MSKSNDSVQNFKGFKKQLYYFINYFVKVTNLNKKVILVDKSITFRNT